MIAIIDFGISNIASVANMIQKVGGTSTVINDSSELRNIDSNKIILPGVGSFNVAMSQLKKNNWIEPLNEFISTTENKVLGICLGMQLLFEGSEEGTEPGLGWINGKVKKFKFKETKLKIPHMGWNVVNSKRKSSLFQPINKEQRFYFVHSYYANCDEKEDVVATCNYGFEFVCAVQKDNVSGVQFHPEKSHRFGMEFFKNYIDLK